MSKTINVTIRLDRDIKEQSERMFNDLGMNLSTAFNIFVRQSLRQGKIWGKSDIDTTGLTDGKAWSLTFKNIQGTGAGSGVFSLKELYTLFSIGASTNKGAAEITLKQNRKGDNLVVLTTNGVVTSEFKLLPGDVNQPNR